MVLRMIELASFDREEQKGGWGAHVDRILSSADPLVAKVAAEVRKVALKR